MIIRGEESLKEVFILRRGFLGSEKICAVFTILLRYPRRDFYQGVEDLCLGGSIHTSDLLLCTLHIPDPCSLYITYYGPLHLVH